jgi:pimeloyl-ACP methyl ester carboxylesterase
LFSVVTVPYANNQGVRIHYEVEGNGPPLVLVHGLAGYLEQWHELGYVDSLKKEFTLILMDLRGHGGSDKPHDPEAYKLKLLVADMIAVMDVLNISKTHFLGYSLGGRMAFALAKYAPERFHSFIIGGQSPQTRLHARIRWWLQILKKGMSAYVELLEKEPGVKMTPQMRTKILSNDTEALAAFVSSSEWRANLEDALPNMTMPCLFFVGETDPSYAGARKCANLLPNAEFGSFPGLGHDVDFQSHLVLPHIKKFLEKVGHT